MLARPSHLEARVVYGEVRHLAAASDLYVAAATHARRRADNRRLELHALVAMRLLVLCVCPRASRAWILRDARPTSSSDPRSETLQQGEGSARPGTLHRHRMSRLSTAGIRRVMRFMPMRPSTSRTRSSHGAGPRCRRWSGGCRSPARPCWSFSLGARARTRSAPGPGHPQAGRRGTGLR